MSVLRALSVCNFNSNTACYEDCGYSYVVYNEKQGK